MMELLDCMGQNIGFIVRIFRVNVGLDFSDRFMWTDSSVDRVRKEKVSLFDNYSLVYFLLVVIYLLIELLIFVFGYK